MKFLKIYSDFVLQKSIKNDHIRQIEKMVRNTVNMGLIVDKNMLPFHEVSKDDKVVFLENEVWKSYVIDSF